MVINANQITAMLLRFFFLFLFQELVNPVRHRTIDANIPTRALRLKSLRWDTLLERF